MDEKSERGRRGGSLVIPLLLILLGILLLLDSLGIIPGVDWATLLKFWPLILIAIGVEIILGRRVSCAGIFLLGIVVVIGGALTLWSVVDEGELHTDLITFPTNGAEQARLDLDVGVGKLLVAGESDMSQLLVAELELAQGESVDSGSESRGDVAEVWLTSKGRFQGWPQLFGNKGSTWDVGLNDRVRWELNVNTGVGEAQLDLSDLRVSELVVHSGVSSVEVILPQRGTTEVRIDGGLGDVSVEIPPGTPARFKVDRGLSGLSVDSRFKRQGDYYETDDFTREESYVYMEIDMGIGNITIR